MGYFELVTSQTSFWKATKIMVFPKLGKDRPVTNLLLSCPVSQVVLRGSSFQRATTAALSSVRMGHSTTLQLVVWEYCTADERTGESIRQWHSSLLIKMLEKLSRQWPWEW